MNVDRIHRLKSKSTDLLLGGFYTTVAANALVGQVIGAHDTLGFPIATAIPAVATVELGGIALAAYADYRRRLGERAYAAQALSAAVAVYAVAFNWFTHPDTMRAVYFAGMSALGYLVWLLHSGARRRDQLRKAGNLPELSPVYGCWRWLTQFRTVIRARALAQADPTLGLHGSLAAVAEQDRTTRRTKALAALLHRKVKADKSPLEAEIAATVYDLDELAARICAQADYDALARILAADLVPAKVAGTKVGGHTCKSKAAGGKYTAGCEGCDNVIARNAAKAKPGRAPRQRKPQHAPVSPAPNGRLVDGVWVPNEPVNA